MSKRDDDVLDQIAWCVVIFVVVAIASQASIPFFSWLTKSGHLGKIGLRP